jgi:hypothetical protein
MSSAANRATPLVMVKAGATGKFGHPDPEALTFCVKLPM